MFDADTIIHEALKRRFGERSIQVTLVGTEIAVRPFRDIDPGELRRRAKEHGMALHHGEGYVAISQWNIDNDVTTYYVVRE